MYHFAPNPTLGTGRADARRHPAEPLQALRGGALTEIMFIVVVAASLLLALPTVAVPHAPL